MEKIYGTKQRQDCLVRTGRSKWILFFGFWKDDEKSESYNPQIEMFARFKTKSSFHKTKRII